MSDDPRVTVPAKLVEEATSAIEDLEQADIHIEPRVIKAVETLRALVDAAERPDDGSKRVAGAVGYGWSGEEVFDDES